MFQKIKDNRKNILPAIGLWAAFSAVSNTLIADKEICSPKEGGWFGEISKVHHYETLLAPDVIALVGGKECPLGYQLK